MGTARTGNSINGSSHSSINDDFEKKADSSEYDQFKRSTASESTKEPTFFNEMGWSATGLEEELDEMDTIPVSQSFEPIALPQHNVEAQFIIRKHISDQLLDSLQKIQEHIGEPSAAIFARKIIELILDMRDRIPFDPFLDVAMALYDALAYKNLWVKYTADQYKVAYKILYRLINVKDIKDKNTDKAILELEELGFNVLPFEVSIDLDSET